MRAFRNVLAELLKKFLSTGPKTFEEIEHHLTAARLHPTGRHWVDDFILPTLLVHQFERAERKGDINLKLLTLQRMMKYFFVAGHIHYARYLTYYLLEMNALPEQAKVDILSAGIMQAIGMLCLPTSLENRLPSELAREV